MGIINRAESLTRWLRIVLVAAIALVAAIGAAYLVRGASAVSLLVCSNAFLLFMVARLLYLQKSRSGREVDREEAASHTPKQELIRQLEESEKHFRTLVDNFLSPVVIFQDFRIKFANRLFYSITGYTPEEVMSEDFDIFSFVHKDDRASAVGSMKRLLAGETINEPLELQVIKKSGEIRTALTFSSLISFDGKPAVETIAVDITRMKEMERELAKTKERLQYLLDNAPIMIFSVDRDGNFIYANKETLRVTGYSAGKWEGTSFASFVHPDDLAFVMKKFEEGRSGSLRRDYKLRIRNSSGEVRAIRVNARTIHEDGEFAGSMVIASDTTENERLQEQLARDKEFIDRLIENANAMIGVVDEKGKFVVFNRRFEEVTGFTKKEALGKDPLSLYVPEESREIVIRKMREGADVHHIEIPIVSKDGKPLVATWSGARVKLPSGKDGVVIVGQDVTGEKRIQEELVQSKKLASIGKLISGVAHELNNPLTIVMGYSQIMSAEQELPEKHREMVQKVWDAAARSKRIVENLLAFARKKRPEKHEVNINELIEDMLLLREHNFNVNNVRIVRNYDESLPVTCGDGHQLQQVFLNLINNAFDAMYAANRGGTLEVKTYRSDGNIILEFIDDGPGVPDSLQEKIFDPFFTTKEVGEGTGLGMSLSYGIMKEHGGRIYLDRAYRDGAKFVIELPLIKPAALSADQAS